VSLCPALWGETWGKNDFKPQEEEEHEGAIDMKEKKRQSASGGVPTFQNQKLPRRENKSRGPDA